MIVRVVLLVSVVSRKTHGGGSTFDVPIDTSQTISGAVTAESRAIGPGHAIVFAFNGTISNAGTASAVDEYGSAVATTLSASGTEVTVTLPSVPDNKRVAVSLSNVNAAGVSAAAAIGFLVGDVDSSRAVTASDILRVKGRSGLSVDANNFRHAVTLGATIGQSDIDAVKLRAGLALP